MTFLWITYKSDIIYCQIVVSYKIGFRKCHLSRHPRSVDALVKCQHNRSSTISSHSGREAVARTSFWTDWLVTYKFEALILPVMQNT